MPETTAPRRVAPVDHDPVALKWARERAGFTQAQLARATNLSRSLVSEAEKGTRSLSPANRIRVAAALNCPVTVLERRPEPR